MQPRQGEYQLHALLGTYGVELRELLYQREELTALITKAIQQDYYVILDTNDLENVHKPDANEVRAQSQYHFILIIGVDTQGRQMIVYDSKFRNTLNYGIFRWIMTRCFKAPPENMRLIAFIL